jgi:hypothetical protein
MHFREIIFNRCGRLPTKAGATFSLLFSFTQGYPFKPGKGLWQQLKNND